MAYGLMIYGNNGNVRLSTEDRLVRYIGTFTGTVTANNTKNVTISGMADDGTWGLNELSPSQLVDVSIHSGYFKVTNPYSMSISYKVMVFRI